MQLRHLNNGYITLLATLIVSSIIVSSVIILSLINLDETKFTQDTKNAKLARSYNTACIESALMQIRNNISYTGGSTINLDQGNCTYNVQNTGGSNRLVTSTATIATIIKNVTVQIDKINPTINVIDWEETP